MKHGSRKSFTEALNPKMAMNFGESASITNQLRFDAGISAFYDRDLCPGLRDLSRSW